MLYLSYSNEKGQNPIDSYREFVQLEHIVNVKNFILSGHVYISFITFFLTEPKEGFSSYRPLASQNIKITDNLGRKQ